MSSLPFFHHSVLFHACRAHQYWHRRRPLLHRHCSCEKTRTAIWRTWNGPMWKVATGTTKKPIWVPFWHAPIRLCMRQWASKVMCHKYAYQFCVIITQKCLALCWPMRCHCRIALNKHSMGSPAKRPKKWSTNAELLMMWPKAQPKSIRLLWGRIQLHLAELIWFPYQHRHFFKINLRVIHTN